MVNRIAEFFAGSANQQTTPRDKQPMAWERLPEMAQPIEETIVKNPGLALAAALAIGVTLGCLIKRR